MTALVERVAEPVKDRDQPKVESKPGGGGLRKRGEPTVSARSKLLLLLTLGIDMIMATILAVWDFAITRTASGLFGAALLLAVAIACGWSICAILHRSATWLAATVFSQVSVALLAGYIVMTDFRSPKLQLDGYAGIAMMAGVASLIWVVRLGRHAKVPLSKGTAALVAVIPALGIYQSWMETDYIPRSSLPLIDASAELKPIGTKDSRVYLEAKVTLQNRGPLKAVYFGGLIRVTSYPKDLVDQPADTNVADGIDLSGQFYGSDYRAKSIDPAEASVIFADDFLPAGVSLGPGQKTEYKRVVEIDSGNVRLVRLSVSAAFVNDSRVKQMNLCDSDSDITDRDPNFSKKAKEVHVEKGVEWLCVENQLAPTDVLQRLFGDDPVLRVVVVTKDPTEKESEYPKLFVNFDTRNKDGASDKVANANPSAMIRDLVAEYSPTDQSPPESAVVNAADTTR